MKVWIPNLKTVLNLYNIEMIVKIQSFFEEGTVTHSLGIIHNKYSFELNSYWTATIKYF